MTATATCHTCDTDDFTAGAFADVTTPPEQLGTIGPDARENLFCLTCAAKYESDGTARFEPLPTGDQLATLHDWWAAGIGSN